MTQPSPTPEPTTPSPPCDDSAGAASATTPGDGPSSRAAGDVPARVGRYEVRERLGAGAFGSVFRAYDPKLKRDVAIKVPNPNALTPDLRARFLVEAEAAAAIHHPNVCPIFDVETDGDLPFLVMRYVAGGTLAGMLEQRRKPYPAREAVAVVRKIALGVAAAHAKGVLHRDLKPANVLWDEAAREVLVTDFGLARVAGAAQLSRTGDILGTPAYMSPEQARAKQDEIGPLTDVYSLGVILYRLVTGVVPFEGSALEVLAQAQFNEPRPPSVVRPGLDPRFDALCAKAMARNVHDRYASATALADALGDFLRAPPAAETERRTASTTHRPVTPQPPSRSPVSVPEAGTEQAEWVRITASEPVTDAHAVSRPGGGHVSGILMVFGFLVAVGACLAFVSWLARTPPTVGGDTTKTRDDKAPVPTGPRNPAPTESVALPPLPRSPKLGDVITFRVGSPAVEMAFCWIPPGTFDMGSNHPEGEYYERGVHAQWIPRGFWMGRTEVTQAQWMAVIGTDPSKFKGPNRPVETVSWHDAQAYCRTLTDGFKARLKVRLPTEVEWEYAARAGTTTEYHLGDRIDATVANYNAESTWNGSPIGPFRGQTVDVGRYPSNSWGLCDIHGNVWEWCLDQAYDYRPRVEPEPILLSGVGDRVTRGGAWRSSALNCRVAHRIWGQAHTGSDTTGFRVCFRPD